MSANPETATVSEPLHIISLGAGVQSSTMALMAAAGEITPMPNCAIFADTQDEPASVYKWLDWLEKQLPFPVHRVTAGKLSEVAVRLKKSRKSGNIYTPIGLPVFTVETVTIRSVVGEDDMFRDAVLSKPYTVNQKGMGMRQCTRTFKIDPIRRKMRSLRAGLPVIQWIGISSDEAHRMKESRDKWCANRWPLIDLGMTRKACLEWMQQRGLPRPPRSACTYCPYHNDAEWIRLKTEEPEAFAEAIAFEDRLQTAYKGATALRSTPYLHSSRKPLATVEFSKTSPVDNFGNECEGMCGV